MVLLYHFCLGVPQVVVSRFDPEIFCASVEKYKVTMAGVVPPILVVLLQHPAAEKYSLRSLVLLTSGAAPLGLELVNRVKAKFSKLGNNDIVITQGYGFWFYLVACLVR